MSHISKLGRGSGRYRASLLATLLVLPFAGCNTDELTEATAEDISTPAEVVEPVTTVQVETPSFASTFKGGIPIGTFGQPITAFGERFNGGKLTVSPNDLIPYLTAVKARGGKAILMFAGHERYYRTGGRFDIRKWKARVARFNNIKFSGFINDGTIIGHYLIDEPNDAHNWGKPVPASVLEEMAKYSKDHWPTMPTMVRAEPGYLATNHRYLDAAWAQYVQRKGTPAEYLRRNVADAQKRGLGLVLGMNITKGALNKRPMSANQLRDWGSIMLGGSYACAFISWTYDKKYISRSDVAGAMSYLAGKARSKSARSCRGGKAVGGAPGGGGGGGGGGEIDRDRDKGKNDRGGKAGGNKGKGGKSRGGSAGSGSGGKSSHLTLRARGHSEGRRHFTTLTWSGAKGDKIVYLFRNGFRIARTRNDGRYEDSRRARGRGSYVYKVCKTKTGGCSNRVHVVIR